MTTLNLQVSFSADDAFEQDTGDTVINGNAHICDQADEWFGHRWRNVTIPQGATINSAAFAVYITSSTTDEPDVYTLAEAADDAAAFTAGTGNEDISGRTQVSAALTVEVKQADLGSSGGFYTMTPTNPPNNYGALVADIVNRSGWSSGNALVFITSGNPGISGTRDLGLDMYDLNSARGAKLDIDYTAGGSTTHNRVLNNSAGLSTAVAAAKLTNHARLIADSSIGCSSTMLLQRIFSRFAAEQIRLADETDRQSDANRLRADDFGTADATRRRSILLRAIADEMGVEDLPSDPSLLIRRFVADAFGLNDGHQQSIEWQRRAVEMFSAVNSIEQAADLLRRLASTIGAGDNSDPRRIRGNAWPGETSIESLGPETVSARSTGPGDAQTTDAGPGTVRATGIGPGDVTVQSKLLKD